MRGVRGGVAYAVSVSLVLLAGGWSCIRPSAAWAAFTAEPLTLRSGATSFTPEWLSGRALSAPYGVKGVLTPARVWSTELGHVVDSDPSHGTFNLEPINVRVAKFNPAVPAGVFIVRGRLAASVSQPSDQFFVVSQSPPGNLVFSSSYLSTQTGTWSTAKLQDYGPMCAVLQTEFTGNALSQGLAKTPGSELYRTEFAALVAYRPRPSDGVNEWRILLAQDFDAHGGQPGRAQSTREQTGTTPLTVSVVTVYGMTDFRVVAPSGNKYVYGTPTQRSQRMQTFQHISGGTYTSTDIADVNAAFSVSYADFQSSLTVTETVSSSFELPGGDASSETTPTGADSWVPSWLSGWFDRTILGPLRSVTSQLAGFLWFHDLFDDAAATS